MTRNDTAGSAGLEVAPKGCLPLLRSFALWLLSNIIPFAVVGFVAASFGHYRGYQAGAHDMRDAIMCVMDRVSGEPVGKGESAYCVSIGEQINKRPPAKSAPRHGHAKLREAAALSRAGKSS